MPVSLSMQQFPATAPIQSVTPVIGFIDIDAFECQLYQRDNPETRKLPCVVGNKGGRVVAVSHEARKFGVSRTDTPYVRMARAICPGLHVFEKPDLFEKQDQKMCRDATYEITMCLKNYLEANYPDVVMEVASSDEVYLNITSVVTKELRRTGNQHPEALILVIPQGVVLETLEGKLVGPSYYMIPHRNSLIGLEEGDSLLVNTRHYAYKNQERLVMGAQIMKKIAIHLKLRTHLNSSAGVSSNKLLAKIGCSLNKPKMITVLPEEAVTRISRQLPITAVPGMGGQVGEILQEEFEVRTMNDIQRLTSWNQLEERFDREKVQEILARGRGKDETPVFSKLMKEAIRCNKPRGDITSLRRLKTVLHNLYCEINILLNEEIEHWNRTVDEVAVSWKTSKCEEATTKLFSLRSPSGEWLHKRVLEEIKITEDFDPQDFQIIELSFCLKYWRTFQAEPGVVEPQNDNGQNDNGGDADIDGGRKLSVSSTSSEESGNGSIPMKLRLNRERPLPPVIPQLSQVSLKGYFRINNDFSYEHGINVKLPTLRPEPELVDLKSYNLLKNYDERLSPRGLLTDYTTYCIRKHEHFARWLKDNDGILDGIHIVSSLGTLIRAFKTTENLTHGDYRIYGVNNGGVIYLWEELMNRTARLTCRDDTSYAGYLFENLIVGNEPEGPIVDGITKEFPVQKLTFGKHEILMLGLADAVDEDGSLVQAALKIDETCFRQPNPSLVTERKLKLWAQSFFSGSNSVVIGTKDNRNFIQKVEKLSVHDLSQQIPEEKRKLCHIFLNRFLDFVRLHLETPDPNVVKTFAWGPLQSNVVHCSIEPLSEICNLLIPKTHFPVEERISDVTSEEQGSRATLLDAIVPPRMLPSSNATLDAEEQPQRQRGYSVDIVLDGLEGILLCIIYIFSTLLEYCKLCRRHVD